MTARMPGVLEEGKSEPMSVQQTHPITRLSPLHLMLSRGVAGQYADGGALPWGNFLRRGMGPVCSTGGHLLAHELVQALVNNPCLQQFDMEDKL